MLYQQAAAEDGYVEEVGEELPAAPGQGFRC
jgi:hypothetical protein